MDAQLDILPIHFYYFNLVNEQLAQNERPPLPIKTIDSLER